jgi:hypothetical protein
MKYQIILGMLSIMLMIGCSGGNGGNREGTLGPTLPGGGNNSGIESYYNPACAPSNIMEIWENAYDVVEGKDYVAFNLDDTPGKIVVERGDFGAKDILGVPFPYQYGLYLNFNRVNGEIQPNIVVLWSEPIGNLSRRILSDTLTSGENSETRDGQMVPCNVGTVNKAWLGANGNYSNNMPRPLLYFTPDDSTISNCKIDWQGYQDLMPDVWGADVRKLEFIYGKFWATNYDAVHDTISGRLVMQLTYDNIPFIQIWGVALEKNT